MTLKERLRQLAKGASEREEYAYHQTGKLFSGSDCAEAPLYGMLAKVYRGLANGEDVETLLAKFDADWRQYAEENNGKVAAAPKIKRGPRSGQSCIEHRWVSPDAAKGKSIHVLQMLKTLTGESNMSEKKQKEKRKARLVSARKMAEASMGKVSKAYKLPPGRTMFNIEGDKNYTFDIVCYAAGKGNPGADEGFDAAGRPYSAHGGIGPNNDRYCCPFNTFDGKPCPVCDARSNRMKQGFDFKDELVSKWRASDRTLWNVWDHANKDKKCQLFDISNFAFAAMLYKTVDENIDRYEYWASPGVEGFTIKASFEKKKMSKGDFPNCWKIELLPRKEPIPDDVLESAMCLDDMLICPDYGKLKGIFEQGSEPAEDAVPSNGSHPAPATKPWPEQRAGEYQAGDWVTYRGKLYEVVSIRDGMANLEDMDGTAKREVDPDDCERAEKPKPAAVLMNGVTFIKTGGKKKPKDEEE